MDRFYVGQRCTVHAPGLSWHGCLCTITAPLHSAEVCNPGALHGSWMDVYSVSVDGAPEPHLFPNSKHRGYAMPPYTLRPLDDRAAFERFMARSVEPVVSVRPLDKATAK